MSVKSCAITGHRPTRFKFGYKENYTGCKRLKKRLYEQFALLYEKGVLQNRFTAYLLVAVRRQQRDYVIKKNQRISMNF